MSWIPLAFWRFNIKWLQSNLFWVLIGEKDKSGVKKDCQMAQRVIVLFLKLLYRKLFFQCSSVATSDEGNERIWLAPFFLFRHQNQHFHAGRPGVTQHPIRAHQRRREVRWPVLLRRVGWNKWGENPLMDMSPRSSLCSLVTPECETSDCWSPAEGSGKLNSAHYRV